MCKRETKQELMKKPNVIGVGPGEKKVDGQETGEECITVFVNTKVSMNDLNDDELVPEEAEGKKTDVVEIGEIVAERREPQAVQAQAEDTQARHRPMPIGVSVGHLDVTAGTAGPIAFEPAKMQVGNETVVYPQPVSISNNHVYANENDARIGDNIIQPGPFDGGKDIDEEFRIGELAAFVELKVGEVNEVDAAYCRLDDGRMATGYIPKVGYPTETTEVQVGDVVEKFGRTTGYRKGKVLSTDASIKVRYNSGLIEFDHQIITESISQPGDSGSAGVKDGKYFGLLFAGSKNVTVFNDINTVLDELGVYIDPEEVKA